MEFDSFAAELRCPTCQTIASGDMLALMQTRIQADPSGRLLYVGDRVDVAPGGPANNGYLAVRPAQAHTAMHLLEVWTCGRCASGPNWAEVVIERGLIQSITAVPLSRATLDQINYITDELVFYFDEITGVPLYQFNQQAPPERRSTLQPNWLDLLYNSL
ncbi:hypothetical protein F8S13_17740 [Chloroflexia bacterium SDU3-3]|nr:hypothetical protein F8S13_17740 [Chloroflexia bacterium SDU3-3]